MRVLQLISSAGLYGAEMMLANLATELEALGCPAAVGVFHNSHRPNEELAAYARSRGLTVDCVRCNGRVDWKAIGRVRNALRDHAADVLHTHGYKAAVYGYLAARTMRTPLLATCHNWADRRRRMKLYAWLDRLVLSRFDKVVAVSDSVAAVLSGLVPEDRLAVIPNGVEVVRFAEAAPSLTAHLPKLGGQVVGMVGRLVVDKGGHLLLQAARDLLRELPTTVFVFVGDGPARERLQEMAVDFGIECNVVFTGERRDMPGVYASMDIFVLPSLNEAMPMTVLEAMAARRPVIASNVGGIAKAVINGQTGLLVTPGDVHSLRDGLVRLLRDPSLSRRLGQRGAERVIEHFSSRTMAARYLNIYQQLASDARETAANAASASW